MSETEKSFESEFATKVITRAWGDPEYKTKLMTDPRAALAEAGLNAPAGLDIKVVENTNNVVHLVLPPPPSAEISEESLALVSG
jgi:D-alanyl-D-alanine carboxypeptidase